MRGSSNSILVNLIHKNAFIGCHCKRVDIGVQAGKQEYNIRTPK